eukprot:gene11614-biopygen16046
MNTFSDGVEECIEIWFMGFTSKPHLDAQPPPTHTFNDHTIAVCVVELSAFTLEVSHFVCRITSMRVHKTRGVSGFSVCHSVRQILAELCVVETNVGNA